MNKDKNTEMEGVGLSELTDREPRVQLWVSPNVWAIPISLGLYRVDWHFFLQVLCFNLAIEFRRSSNG